MNLFQFLHDGGKLIAGDSPTCYADFLAAESEPMPGFVRVTNVCDCCHGLTHGVIINHLPRKSVQLFIHFLKQLRVFGVAHVSFESLHDWDGQSEPRRFSAGYKDVAVLESMLADYQHLLRRDRRFLFDVVCQRRRAYVSLTLTANKSLVIQSNIKRFTWPFVRLLLALKLPEVQFEWEEAAPPIGKSKHRRQFEKLMHQLGITC